MNRAKWIVLAIASCAAIALLAVPTASADGGIDCSKARAWNSNDAPSSKGTLVVYEGRTEYRCKAEKCGENPAFYGNLWERVGDCKSGTAPK